MRGWKREKNNVTSRSKPNNIWNTIAFRYWNLFGIYSSFFQWKNQKPKSVFELRLCIKIDGITFDCSPSVHTHLHMCVLWTELNRSKNQKPWQTHRMRDRNGESERESFRYAFYARLTSTMKIGFVRWQIKCDLGFQ